MDQRPTRRVSWLGGQALSNDSELTQLAHARLLTVSGLLDMWLGDYDSSLPALHQGVAMARELGDDDVLASSLLGVSLVSSFVGNTEVARVNADEALTLFRGRADRWGQATAFSLITWFIVGADAFDANSQVFEDALVVADELADEVNRAMIETNVAEQRLHLGRHDEAADLLARSLHRYAALRALYPTSYAIDCVARLAAGYGNARTAASLLGAANRMREIISVPIEGSHRARRAQLEDQIRTQHVDQTSYDEALADGRAMSFDDAIEFATLAVRRYLPASTT